MTARRHRRGGEPSALSCAFLAALPVAALLLLWADGAQDPVAESPPVLPPVPHTSTTLGVCSGERSTHRAVLDPLPGSGQPGSVRRGSGPPRAVWGFTVGHAVHFLGFKTRYDVPAPFVAAAWRRIGYEPQIYVVAEDEAHARSLRSEGANGSLVLRLLREMKVSMEVVTPAEGRTAGQTGQLVRMAAVATETLWEAPAVIMADADMLPLSQSYFLQGRGGPGSMAVYNHLIMPDQFAMCYLEASAGTWRDILGAPGAPLRSAKEAVEAVFPSTEPVWHGDQVEATARIRAWPGWPDRGIRIPVPTWDGWRLDRINLESGTLGRHIRSWSRCELGSVDFHLPQLGCGTAGLQATLTVLRRLFDDVSYERLARFAADLC